MRNYSRNAKKKAAQLQQQLTESILLLFLLLQINNIFGQINLTSKYFILYNSNFILFRCKININLFKKD
jgi:hypothetical protein